MTWKFEYWKCSKCNKVNHVNYDNGGLVFTPNEKDEKELKDEIDKVKSNNNWCDGNCSNREQNDPNSPNFQLETTSFDGSIKDYFQKYNIQNIKLSDDGKRLLINGKERTPGIGEIFAKDLDVKKYLKDNNKQILNSSELDSIIDSPLPTQNQPVTVHKPFTTKLYEFYQTPTFWTIAIIVGVIDLIYLYFYFFERKKLKEKLRENTLLKIFTYLLAIASVIILIIPIFFLLASLGGNQRTCDRCHRKSGNCCC